MTDIVQNLPNFHKIQKSHALCNSRRTTRDETRRSDTLQGIARRTTRDGRATRGTPRRTQNCELNQVENYHRLANMTWDNSNSLREVGFLSRPRHAYRALTSNSALL